VKPKLVEVHWFDLLPADHIGYTPQYSGKGRMGPDVGPSRTRDNVALDQKQTSRVVRTMSALSPKADINRRHLDVRFVP